MINDFNIRLKLAKFPQSDSPNSKNLQKTFQIKYLCPNPKLLNLRVLRLYQSYPNISPVIRAFFGISTAIQHIAAKSEIAGEQYYRYNKKKTLHIFCATSGSFPATHISSAIWFRVSLQQKGQQKSIIIFMNILLGRGCWALTALNYWLSDFKWL